MMQSMGIDLSYQRSKSVNEFLDQRFDYVITLCDEEICPVFPLGVRRLRWALPHPAVGQGNEEERLEAFRQVATALQSHLDDFLRQHDKIAAGRR